MNGDGGRPPSRRVQGLPPEHKPMPDTHKTGGHGSMRSLRTVQPADTEEHRRMVSTAASGGVKLPHHLQGQRPEVRPHQPHPVRASVPDRASSGTHASTFYHSTQPKERSAKKHAQRTGLDIPTRMEILHAQGYGQVGTVGDTRASNLGAGSFGANSQMIPYDDAVSGHTRVQVTSHHHFYPGTQVLESTTQSFAHPSFQFGSNPFFSQSIAADRTPVTRDEYSGHEARARSLSAYVQRLDRGSVAHSFEQEEMATAKRMSRKRSYSQAFGEHSSPHEPPLKKRRTE